MFQHQDMKNSSKTPNVYDDYPIFYFENFRAFSSDGNLIGDSKFGRMFL